MMIFFTKIKFILILNLVYLATFIMFQLKKDKDNIKRLERIIFPIIVLKGRFQNIFQL